MGTEKFNMGISSKKTVVNYAAKQECPQIQGNVSKLKLVNFSDILHEEQRLLKLDDISSNAKRKALMIIDYIGEWHPSLLADFLNNRAYRAGNNINVSPSNLVVDIEEKTDPREIVVLNYAKILHILRDVSLSPPETWKHEKKFLDI